MRVVVKIGTNVLTKQDGTLDQDRIDGLVSGLAAWARAGWQIVVVSSGAIGAGIGYLGLKKRPQALRDKQAAAAIGQVQLMGIYNGAFHRHGIKIAQILLTREDLMNHKRYLNTRNTVMALLDMNVIPIINENDTVSVDEIVLGDNDTLAAIVAMKVEAQKLIILTDVDGLFKQAPHGSKQQECIPVVEKITPAIENMSSSATGSAAGTGGMVTKVQAAKIAVRAGVEVVIANGCTDTTLSDIFSGRSVGTTFLAEKKALKSKKRWIAFGARVQGVIRLDHGAVNAICRNSRSLLPAGVTGVEGTFAPGDAVSITNEQGGEVARGISSFSSEELMLIKGKKSSQVQEILKRGDQAEVIHRDNLVIM